MAERTAAKERAAHLAEHAFKPGESGNPNGRPKGSRNKLGEAFVAALHDDFLEHGKATIEKVRKEDPTAYVKVCASLLPKEIKVERTEDMTDDELNQRIKQLAAALSLELGGEARTGEPAGGTQTSPRPH